MPLTSPSTNDSAPGNAVSSGTTPPLPQGTPEAAGFIASYLEVADQLVRKAVAEEGIPGAVLAVGRNGIVALRKAYGHAALRPQKREMTCETIFDLASLTKPIATATAIAILLDTGQIELDAPVGRYLPPFAAAGGDKAKITIRHLLTHASGMPAGMPFQKGHTAIRQFVEEIANVEVVYPLGERCLYSDLSFMALGDVIQEITGKSLDTFCHDHIFGPLGMTDTTFGPGVKDCLACAATGDEDDPDKCGTVHDPRAAMLNGVMGHAGLFSTVDDLCRYSQMVLNGGSYAGVRLLSPETAALFTSKLSLFEGNDRGFGWDRDSGYSIRGALPKGSFGHTGFTGTAIWIDPSTKTFIVLLTNAVHAPTCTDTIKVLIRVLRPAVSTAVAAAIIG